MYLNCFNVYYKNLKLNFSVGPAYDDQLKQLQDKVGRLTKEIATQSSFVKGLPVSMVKSVTIYFLLGSVEFSIFQIKNL